MSSRKLTPFQRIMRNAESGKGVLLSADEVRAMAEEKEIQDLASNDDAAEKRAREREDYA